MFSDSILRLRRKDKVCGVQYVFRFSITALGLATNFTSKLFHICNCPTADTLVATELRGPVDFDFKILRDATSNFSEANKLGEGGFGEVYKVGC